MSHSVNILVVDDDLVTRTRHKHYFDKHGYKVFLAQDGNSMWHILREECISLILLDIGLPGKDGLELARELRAHDEYLGIILVTARDDDIDKIVGLESGANDYVTKPFNPRELLARVKIVLRSTYNRRPQEDNSIIKFGNWLLNLDKRLLYNSAGQRINLPRGEMGLLTALARNPGATVNRQILINHVSDRPWESTNRTVDVLVSRLRRRLETDPKNPQLIVTVHGEGYALMGF